MDATDSVSDVVEQWHRVMPSLDVSPIAIPGARSQDSLDRAAPTEEIFDDFDLSPLTSSQSSRCADEIARSDSVSRNLPRHWISRPEPSVCESTDCFAWGSQRGPAATRDSRVHWVELTDLGERRFEQLAPLHLDAQRELLALLTSAQRAALVSLLTHWLSTLESGRNLAPRSRTSSTATGARSRVVYGFQSARVSRSAGTAGFLLSCVSTLSVCSSDLRPRRGFGRFVCQSVNPRRHSPRVACRHVPTL